MEIERFLRSRCETDYHNIYFVNLPLDKAGSEVAVCFRCWKPLSGRIIKNSSVLYSHQSCSNVSSKMESLLLHFRSGHGDLIFTGVLKNKGKEDAVCLGCEKPVVVPGYECSAPECKFLLHQSCAQLPRKLQHPFHPDHTLSLREPQCDCYCKVCNKDCTGCFSYRCNPCNFRLDLPCATWRMKDKDDCHHEYRSIFMKSRFSCDACGEEGEGLAVQCNICQLLIQRECGQFSRIIKITAHRHCLFITYSLREVKEGENIFCNICSEKIETKYGAYFCKRCPFVAHFKCAVKHLKRVCEESDDLDYDVEEEYDGELVEGAVKIRHFSHHHILNLCKEELVDNRLCDACMGMISAPFYSCTVCNYLLHNGCVRLPRKKKHLLHQHTLTLTSKFPDDDLFFQCNACARSSQGFSYHCAECKFYLDLKCFSMPATLEYEGHPHSLFLALHSKENCKACVRNHEDKEGIYMCTKCELVFCFECATFPFEVRHRFDEHFLKFTFVEEKYAEDYYCSICEEETEQKSWIYYCPKCDFSVHTDCVVGRQPYLKFGKFFKTRHHKHPIAFVKGDDSCACDICRKAFECGIECAECKICTCSEEECLYKSDQLSKAATAIASGAEEVGGTSAGNKGERDSVEENNSGLEDAGGTSIGTGGGHDSGKGVIFDEEIDSVDEVGSAEKIDSCAEERRGLAQAPKAVVEIDSGAEDAGGTIVATRGGWDSGEGIDSGGIDSSTGEAGELGQAPEAGVSRSRRLSRVRGVIRGQQRRVLAIWRRISARLHL